MSELQLIETVVRQAGRRRRLHRFWVGLWMGLLFGSLTCLVVLALYKVFPLPTWLPWAGLGAGALVWLGMALAPACRRVSSLETARWVDHKGQLHERLSTALELAAKPQHGEWEKLVVDDAAARLKTFDPSRFLPLHFPRVGRWALLAAVLAVGLGFVPEYRSKSFREREEDQARIRETGRKLSELVRQDLARREPLLEPTQKAMEQVVEVGDALVKAPRTRDAALRDLASVQNKLSEQARELAEQPGIRPLHEAAREPGGTGASRELQEKMAALQKALGKAAEEPGKLGDLQRELESLRKEAAALAQKDPAAAAAARAELAQALAKAAEQARDLGAALPSLDAAIAALEASQDDAFLRDLNAAVTELDKLQEMARSLQNMAQQASKTGKDLAEQLEKGQAQAAQASLQRMIEQLQSAHISDEQLQKLIEEVSKAIAPASEYGQVARELQKAAQQLKAGEKGEAAQCLANAAEQLQDMMKQMQDLDALEGALAALARSQNALAARKTWAQAKAGDCTACNGMGCEGCNGPRRWGKGGGKGAGVGTWADNDSNYLPPLEGPPPDNSGVQRPDMDSRGIADRAAQLSENLLPDRIKGQLSPGESMPSISLKGVSIRGSSSVQFEEAAVAAQAEAQSALNQDRVPRAYQSVVKDYFDDLKR